MPSTLMLLEEDDAVALRMQARLRAAGFEVQRVAQSIYEFGNGHVLDVQARALSVHARTIALTLREYELLHFLLRHPRQVFSRDELIERVWGKGFDGFPHTVSSHINRLRAKIEAHPQRPRLIQTAWGVGYRFEPNGELQRELRHNAGP
ncbi:MAG TPA: response regulator transcription factor [Burkholderiaceae bacterium]|jgi:DNA-binding response OmpR family regulator